MTQFTDYTLELMAKGWLSLNKDKPEHVQEVELAKLLKALIKSHGISMSQLTDYSLELMAKGWLSLNKDKPEHVQEVELSKLLKEIKSVCEHTVPSNKIVPV